MAISPIPNTRQRKLIQAGTELVRGTAVTPEYKWYGDLIINKRTPLADVNDYAGGYDEDLTPQYGFAEIDGSYAVPLAYQDLVWLPRYGVAVAPAGVSDSQATPGYVYTYEPNFDVDDIESATIYHGFDGIPFSASMVMFNEFTIRGSVDDAANVWMWDSRVFARTKTLITGLSERGLTNVAAGPPMVLTPTGGGLTIDALIGQYLEVMTGPGASQVAGIDDNDVTTITLDRVLSPAPTTGSTIEVSGEFVAGLSDRTRNRIAFEGTRIFIGDAGDTIGTEHQLVGRFKGFSVTVQNGLSPKRMAEDVGGYSVKVDRGRRRVTAQMTFEFDDWREVRAWEGQETRLVRIDQVNGPIINASPETRMYGQIDLPALYWESFTESVRNNNILVTYQGRGYRDATLGYSFAIEAKSADATLPGD